MRITKKEYRRLLRYVKGHEVEKEDQLLIDKLASTGMVRIGFYTDEKGKTHQTAKFTSMGRGLVKYEVMSRSPLRRFFHNFISIRS